MGTVRGFPSAALPLSTRRASADESPFSGLGSYGPAETAFALSEGALGEAMEFGLGATWAEQKAKAQQAVATSKSALVRKVAQRKVRELDRKIAQKESKLRKQAQQLTPFLPSPVSMPVAAPVVPPSPTDFAPTPAPSFPAPSSGAPVMPSASFVPMAPVNMVDGGEQPSPDTGAGSGGAGGGLLSSPWVILGLVVAAFVVARGPGSSSLR